MSMGEEPNTPERTGPGHVLAPRAHLLGSRGLEQETEPSLTVSACALDPRRPPASTATPPREYPREAALPNAGGRPSGTCRDCPRIAQEAEPTWPEWNCLLVGIAEFLGQESCLLFWYFPYSIGGFKFCLKLKQTLQTQLFIWSFLSLRCHPVDLHISVSRQGSP